MFLSIYITIYDIIIKSDLDGTTLCLIRNPPIFIQEIQREVIEFLVNENKSYVRNNALFSSKNRSVP